MPFMAKANYGSLTIAEASPMKLKPPDRSHHDYTGQCYGRSPPAGAGREAAGHTSEALSHIGRVPPTLWSLRAVPNTFKIGTIYDMRAPALTTFTLATLTTNMTTQVL